MDEMPEGGAAAAPGVDLGAIKRSVGTARAALAEQAPDAEIPGKPDAAQSPRCVAFHPRGTELACGDREGNLRVFGLGDMRLRAIRPAHDAEVLTADYSPVLRRRRAEVGGATGGGNVVLPTWEAAEPDAPEAEGDLVMLATGSRDRLVHVFEAGRGYGLLQTLENHSSSITAVRFARDGRMLLSCGGDKQLVLNAVNGRHLARLKSVSLPHGSIYDIETDSTNKYMVTSGQDKRVNIWQVRASYAPHATATHV
jgi:WD40 repeat protein